MIGNGCLQKNGIIYLIRNCDYNLLFIINEKTCNHIIYIISKFSLSMPITNVPPMNVDCMWTEPNWSQIECPNSGEKIGTRTITRQQQNNGITCPPTTVTQKCDVDCTWTEPNWSQIECPNSGEKIGTRTITRQQKNNGTTCPPTTVTQKCYYFSSGDGGISIKYKVMNGAGGAGGIVIKNNGVDIQPNYPATEGTYMTYDIKSGYPGTGFGAGGGGQGTISNYDNYYNQNYYNGGNGGNGFVFISYNDVSYFTQDSTIYTFSSNISKTTSKILIMGGGGSGGYSIRNSIYNYCSGSGGGAGYLQMYNIDISNNYVANIVIGKGGNGQLRQDGETTTVTINGVVYSAEGGKKGVCTFQNPSGGNGSSAGGNSVICYQSGSYILATSGLSNGNGGQGVDYFNTILKEINSV